MATGRLSRARNSSSSNHEYSSNASAADATTEVPSNSVGGAKCRTDQDASVNPTGHQSEAIQQDDHAQVAAVVLQGIDACFKLLWEETMEAAGIHSISDKSFVQTFTSWGDWGTTDVRVKAYRLQQPYIVMHPSLCEAMQPFAHQGGADMQSMAASAAMRRDLDMRQAVKRDRNCWGCGMSADEAAAAMRLASSSSNKKPTLLTCNRCRTAKYCCKECQGRHWSSAHKVDCKSVASSGEASISAADLFADHKAQTHMLIMG